MNKRNLGGAVLLLALAGCGGGGGSGGSATTATGVFKDSNTAGLDYVFGGQSGVTGADGSFTYEVGNAVTFSIGGVTLGTSDGNAVVTPIDLVVGGSSGSTRVQNIVRFLMMLDEDGDPDNGISISAGVRSIAGTWSQVDFGTADLQAALTSIISDAASADGGTHTLPNATAAQNHFEATLRCAYAGAYKGTYSGDDSGTFGFLVDAATGDVTGVAYSTPLSQLIGLSGASPISYDQNVAFAIENTVVNASYTGHITSVDSVSGTWAQDADSGSFSGSRIGALNAAYRYTGGYTGDDYGLFSFDLDASNTITGVAYSVAGDELLTLNGTVSGTSLSATASDGTTITGTLNTSTGTLSGTWSDAAEGLSGSFSGSGCKLN